MSSTNGNDESSKEIDLSTALEELHPSLKPPPKRIHRKRTPPPIHAPATSQTLSRTLSASSVLYKVQNQTQVPKKGLKQISPVSVSGLTSSRSTNSSPILPKTGNTNFPELNTARSVDDFHHQAQKSSASVRTIEDDHDNVPSTPIDPEKSFTVTYKQDNNPKSNSRYYERMGARPWLPSLNATAPANKRSMSVHVPHVITNNNNNNNTPSTPLASPPLTPDTQFKTLSKARTPSFPSIEEESQKQMEAPSQQAFKWYFTSSSNKTSPKSASAPSTAKHSHHHHHNQHNNHHHPGHHHHNHNNHQNVDEADDEVDDFGNVDRFFTEDSVPPLSFYAHVPKIFGNEPPQISGHSCTRIGDKLYIFGGKTTEGYTNALHVFNCTTSTLTTPQTKGDIPPPCCDFTATAVDKNHIYYIGGVTETNECQNWIYSLNTNSYTFTKIDTVGRNPDPRKGHSIVYRYHSLYMFGGQTSESTLNDVWKLDIESNTWSEVISLEKDTMHWPGPRAYHSAHELTKGIVDGVNDGMVIYGGNDNDHVYDEVWIFDYGTQRWISLGVGTFPSSPSEEDNAGVPRSPATPPPTSSCPKTLHVSSLAGSNLVVVGGHDGNELSSTVSILNLKTKIWTIKPIYGLQTPGPCYHSGVIHDYRYYIVGGFDSNQILTGIKIIEMPISSMF